MVEVVFIDERKVMKSDDYNLSNEYVDKLKVGDIIEFCYDEYTILRIVKNINNEGYIIYIEEYGE